MDLQAILMSLNSIIQSMNKVIDWSTGKVKVDAQVTVGAVTTGETIVTAPVTRVVTLTDSDTSYKSLKSGPYR